MDKRTDKSLKPPPLPLLNSSSSGFGGLENQPPSSLGMDSIGSIASLSKTPTGNDFRNDANEAMLMEQLAQRQHAFSQLGSFMTAIQNEAQSVELWKSKLKELESMKSERQSLKQELAKAHEESSRANQINTSLNHQLSQLKNELSVSLLEHKTKAVQSEALKLELDKLAVCANKLQEENKAISMEAKAAATLSETNAELNKELGNMKRMLEKTNIEASKAVHEAQARAEQSDREKQELNRHFNNVMEDVKLLKLDLKTSVAHCQDLEESHKKQATLQQTNETSFKTQLEENTATIKQLRQQVSEIEREKNSFESVIHAMRDQGVDGPEQVLSLKSNISALEATCTELNHKLSTKSEAFLMLENEFRMEKEQKLELKEKYSSSVGNLENMKVELSRKKESSEASREELNAALAECDGLRDHCESLGDKLNASLAKNNALNKDIASLNSKLRESEELLHASEQKLDTMEKELRKVVAEEQEEMKRAVAAMQAAQTDDQRQYIELVEKEKHSTILIGNLSQELEKRCDELSTTKHQLELKQKELVNMQEIIKESESSLLSKERQMAASYAKERARLSSEYETAAKKVAALETDKRDFMHEISSLRAELEARKQSEVDQQHVKKQLEKQLAAALKASEFVKSERNEILAELKAVSLESGVKDADKEKELSELREQLKSTEYELKSCRKSMASSTTTLQESIDTLQIELKDLKRENEVLANAKSKSETEMKELIAINDNLESSIAQQNQDYAHATSNHQEKEADLLLKLKRSESTAQELSDQLRQFSHSKQEQSEVMRELSSKLRSSESKCVDLQGELSRAKSKLADAEHVQNELSGRYQELESEVSSTRRLLQDKEVSTLELEKSFAQEKSRARQSYQELLGKLHALEDGEEVLREERDAMATKLNAVQASCSASVLRLEDELRALESSQREERVRANGEIDAVRKQMLELEMELETATTRARANLTAARDETEVQRRNAFEANAQCNELKLKHEAQRREFDALKVELAAAKDSLADAEKRINSQKDALRAAGRDAEAARDQRDAASHAARRAEEQHYKKSHEASTESPYTASYTLDSNHQRVRNMDEAETLQSSSRSDLVTQVKQSVEVAVGNGASAHMDSDIQAHLEARARMRAEQDNNSDDDDDLDPLPLHPSASNDRVTSLHPSSMPLDMVGPRSSDVQTDSMSHDLVPFQDTGSLGSINRTADFLARRKAQIERRNSKDPLNGDSRTTENERDVDSDDDDDDDARSHFDDDKRSDSDGDEEEEYAIENRQGGMRVNSSLEELDPRDYDRPTVVQGKSRKKKTSSSQSKSKHASTSSKVIREEVSGGVRGQSGGKEVGKGEPRKNRSRDASENSAYGISMKKGNRSQSKGSKTVESAYKLPVLPKGRSSRENSR